MIIMSYLCLYHFHFFAPLAVTFLQTLDHLLVAVDAHTVALGKRRREFGKRARIDGPTIVRTLVLHSDVAFVSHSMNRAHFANQLSF